MRRGQTSILASSVVFFLIVLSHVATGFTISSNSGLLGGDRGITSNRRRTILAAERSLVWYTASDLRVHDHEGLMGGSSSPSSSSRTKTPLFIFDPLFLSSMSPHNLLLLLSAVQDVRASLRHLGSDLIIRTGPVENVLEQMAKEVEADEICYYDDMTAMHRSLITRGLSTSTSGSLRRKPWRTRLRATVGPSIGR